MSNLVTKNIIANYVGKIWSFISVYIFVPMYIKILGMESYAVINFYAVILTIMFFADAGFTSTLNRELARSTDKKYLGSLLFTMERVYIVICFVIITTICVFARFVAVNWLKANGIPDATLSFYIRLMGIGVAFQFFSTLYNGGLMGLQRQVLANGLQITWSFFRSGVVLIPLYFYPYLTTFFVWQIVVNGIFLIITRYKLWELIKTNIKNTFDFSLIKGIWKFALGMMLMGMISALNTQLDKLLISKMLSLVDFGYYSLAAVFAQSPIIITTPIAMAVVPQMTRLIAENNQHELGKVFHRFSILIASVAGAVTIVLFFYTRELIFIWTHDHAIADKVDIIAKVLLVGSAFLAFQLMPYYLSIGFGYNKTNIKLGIICIIFIVPSVIILIKKFGLLGAAMPWLVINVMATLVLGYILINRFLKGEFSKWMIWDTLVPLFVSLFCGGGIYLITRFLPGNYFVLFYGAVIGMIIMVVNVLVYNKCNPHDAIDIRKVLLLLNKKRTS